MIRQALLQTPSGSISGSGVTGMNIKPPVPTLVELKAMEETGTRNGILVLGMSRHWIDLLNINNNNKMCSENCKQHQNVYSFNIY